MNLAGIRLLFELEERLGARILEALYAEGTADAEEAAARAMADDAAAATTSTDTPATAATAAAPADPPTPRPSADRTPASSIVGEP